MSAVSVTSSSLVKVSSVAPEWIGFIVAHAYTQILKYSDEDLLKLVQLAKRRAGQRERQKVDYMVIFIQA